MADTNAVPVVEAAPARIQEANTFDQALDQRRRAQASEGSLPTGLMHLGELALRISGRMGGGGAMPLSVNAGSANAGSVGAGAPTAAPASQKVPQGGNASGDDLIDRAKKLIDGSFGYAVLTAQLVRGANQLATGLMTLLRST